MNEKRQKLNEAFFDTRKKKNYKSSSLSKYQKYFHWHHFHRPNLLRHHHPRIGNFWNISRIRIIQIFREDLFSRILPKFAKLNLRENDVCTLKEETFAVQKNREIFTFRGNKLSRMKSYETFRGNKLSR